MRATAYAPAMQSNASNPSPTGGQGSGSGPGGNFAAPLKSTELVENGIITETELLPVMSEPMLKLSAATRFESKVPAATRGEKPKDEADDEAEV